MGNFEFKGTKGKWYSKVTRSSNINGDEAVVVFSENDNPSIDKGICRLTTLNYNQNLVQEELEMKYNALLISKAPEMLEMLIDFVETYESGGVINNEYYIDKFKQLIKEATEL